MEQFTFYLPTLRDNGLIPQDSELYAFNMIPRAAISPAIALLMQNILSQKIALVFDTPKRIDIYMEVFAVALTLDYKYTEQISYVNDIYKSWIEGDMFTKDKSMLNKYYRLIIKQLSSPFDLSRSFPSDYANKILFLLNSIIDTYNKIIELKGSKLDEDTWKLLLYTFLGIINSLLPTKKLDTSSKKISHVKQEAVKTVINILLSSRIYSVDVWDLFTKYVGNWATNEDFLEVWSETVQIMFKAVNFRILNFPDDQEPAFKEIKTQDLLFMFNKVMSAADPKFLTNIDVQGDFLTKTCNKAIKIAIDIANRATKSLCITKYPLLLFLKFFNTLILHPAFKKEVQVETAVENIINLVTKFDLRGVDKELSPMIDFLAVKYGNSSSFMENAVNLLSLTTGKLSVLNDPIFASIETFEMPNMKNETYIIPLFLSASVMTGKPNDIRFNKMWNMTLLPYCRAQLLASSFMFGSDMIFLMTKEISKWMPAQIDFYRWATVFIGTCVRENFFDARNTAMQLLSTISSNFVSDNCDETSTAITLQSWAESIDWGVPATKEMFSICSYATKKFSNKTPTTAYIKSLVNYLQNRASIHDPSPDFFGTLCSASKCNEKETKNIKYITIGDSLLLSFVSTEEKMTLFSRGPFGKCAFEVTEDPFGDMQTPTFIPLPKETIPNLPDPKYGTEDKIQGVQLPSSETKAPQAPDYLKWMSIPVVKFNDKHVTTLTEYLAKTGLLTNTNEFEIKSQSASDAKRVIDEFDKLEVPPVVFIPIRHVMSDDKSLDFTNDKYERTTEYLQDFLSSVAMAYDVSDKAADLLKIPHLRTNVPIAPCGRCLIAFIAPEMAADINGAKKIAEMFDSAKYKIIFNETNAELNIKLTDEPLFIINRITDSKFFVRTGLKCTCFSEAQLMLSGSFTQTLLMLIKYRLFDLNENVISDVTEARYNLIRSLANAKESSPVFVE